MNKIVLIGVGHVGETTARALVAASVSRELVLLDIKDNLAEGIALDIQQAAPLLGSDTRLIGTCDPREMHAADLIIISAGLPRKPGMGRSDLLESNVKILSGIIDNIAEYAAESLLIVATNPADILTYFAWEKLAWPKNRVIGLSGVLDSARMSAFIAMETGFSVSDINTFVVGGHGDAMVPLPRYSTISGIPITQFLADSDIQRIIDRTCRAGTEILGHKKHSSACNAPAAAICTMVDAIVNDKRRILPCIGILEGEFGFRSLAMSVPCLIGRNGVERIIEIELNPTELQLLEKSVDFINKDLATLKTIT